MKSNGKRICAVLFTILLTCTITIVLSNITELKSSEVKNKVFFEQKEDFDVLFYGSSHMVDGIYPMIMWNNHGIVSYNLGSNGNRIPTSYWVYRNSLDYTNPKLVVIDCVMLSQNLKADINFSFLHTTFDEFPLSINKAKAIYDLLDDEEANARILEGTASTNGEKRTPMGLLWDYSVYHSRWNDMQIDDFDVPVSMEKGAESLINVAVWDKHDKIAPDIVNEETTVAEVYLRKMIEDCKSQGIDILLIYLPFMATEKEQAEANTVRVIADECGVDFINFLDLSPVNYVTDFYDGGHLNPSGAKKVSDYLGQYIIENYNVQDRREDVSVAGWHDDYTEYVDKQYRCIVHEKLLSNYLMLLYGVDNRTIIYVADNPIWKDYRYSKLLANLGVDETLLNDSTDFIIIDNDDVIVLDDFMENGKRTDTKLGEIAVFMAEDSENADYGLYIDGEECMVGNSGDNRLHIVSTLGTEHDTDIFFECNINDNSDEATLEVSEALKE